MAIAYYGVKVSDNVTETPEGYLVFKNAVIGRTGFQTYKGKELPQNELEEQGISINPGDDVEVYRAPEEVFSPRTIASFNGKPVTDTHPGQMLDIDSVEDYECGQVFNVREGKEPLEDGNFPLLGDIIVKNKTLIDKWNAGIRELSCGYNYHIAKIGKNICQVDMIGNHVAFVENGRAGAYVKVNDSKPIQSEGKFTMKEFLKQVRKEGLLSLIKSKPDEVAAAFDSMAEAEEKKETPAADSSAVDAKAADRARLHKALDKHLDAKDNAAAEQEATDEADMNALKAIFTTPSAESSKAADSEEEQEEEAEESEEEEHEGGAADESEAEAEGEDEAVQSEASPVVPAGDRPINPVPSAVDAAYKAGAESVLKAFKPFVAKAKNKALTGAFDTTSKIIKGNTWKGNASYGRFARAAATANDSATTSNKADKLAQDAENAYADARKQMLGKK